MRKFVVAIVLFASVAILSPTQISGQSNASLVEGAVQDETGAALQNCSVTLTNSETGFRLETRTNDAGIYLFPSVQPGNYSLSISHDGFKAYEASSIKVTVSERHTQNATLTPGAISTSVLVDASEAGPLNEPTSNELGTLVEQESVRKLPLNGRDFLQLGLLSGAAQTSGTVVSDFLTLQVGHPDRTIVIDGNEQDMTGFYINGMATAGSRLGQASLNISVAAIDQFKIHEGFFLPGESPTAAGTVTVVTRGGGNQFHGEVFEFVRNDIFDARNYFDPPNGEPAPFHRNQFGAAAGGPVLRNRLFVFGHYEGRRQMLSGIAKATVPTEKMFAGDFSELLSLATPIQIYDPESFDAATNKRQPFPGNVIPSARINAMSNKLLAYYRAAGEYGTNNLTGNPKTTDNYDQWGFRVDANINSRNSLFAEYVNENSPTVNPGLFPLSGYGFPLDTNLTMIQWTRTITPHVVNELRVGWLRPSVFSAGESQADIQGKLGFTGTADPNGLPGIFLGGFNLSGSSTAPSFGRNQGLIGNIDNQNQLHEGMSYLKGLHEMSFGADLNYVRTVQESSNFYSRGGVWFSPIYTAQLATSSTGKLTPMAGTGSSFADYLLGMPQNGSVTSMPRTHFRWTAITPYFQDTWRVRNGLTLNMGIGWNVSTPPNAVGHDRNYPHSVDLKSGEVHFAALGEVSPQIYKVDLNNLAPRFGIAWQPQFLTNTVIRAGAGSYYSAENALYELFAITAPGVAVVQSITNDPSQPMPTYIMGENVFPPVAQAPITPEFEKSIHGTVFSLDPKLRTPYINQWSLAIQHSVAKNTIAELDYIGSQSRKLPIRWNADDCSAPGSYVCDQSVKPFKQFNYIYAAANEGTANYNGMVLKLQRQFTDGLSFAANYTWSKVLSNTVQGGAPVGLNQRGTCLSCDKGLAGFNVPQRLVASGVWQLPIGRGKALFSTANRLTDSIAGGWTVNTIATFSKGNPFTVLAANSTAMDPMTNYRADRICHGRDSLRNKNVRTNDGYWIDTSCFVAPAPGMFGNSAPNILTGPGVNNWDIGLGKLIALHEQVNLEFRAESFNALNHTNFLNPDYTMTDASFGRITTAGPARQLQFAMKVVW